MRAAADFSRSMHAKARISGPPPMACHTNKKREGFDRGEAFFQERILK